jgi:DNA-binding transcriptional LysR family regulator
MNWDDIKFFVAVAKTEKMIDAARSLGVDTSTVSRRIYRLEKSLNAQLFERTMGGHILTAHGRLMAKATKPIEQQMQSITKALFDKNLEETGTVRIGTTEAFGSFFLSGQTSEFQKVYPNISIELLPMPRFVKVTTLEADLSISVEKPDSESLIVSKLCDYRLKLYATKSYLSQHACIKKIEDLRKHSLVSYIPNLTFSDQLLYLNDILPHPSPVFSSTSVLAQHTAVINNLGLAILPCFLADCSPKLVPVLKDKINIVRTFWLIAHPEKKRLTRVNKVWGYLKELAAENSKMLMGE